MLEWYHLLGAYISGLLTILAIWAWLRKPVIIGEEPK